MATIASWPSLDEVKKSDDVEACLRWHRFLPPPDDEAKVKIIKAVIERLARLRATDPAAYTTASKRLGWD